MLKYLENSEESFNLISDDLLIIDAWFGNGGISSIFSRIFYY
jgi:hypothetical protein